VVDSNSDFVVRAGKNGFLGEVAPEPQNSLTLQIINIPAYPSLPQALSADMAKIIDTKVANEAFGRRVKNYTVTTVFSATDRSRIQVKAYKMTDIASLERRIKDLEYYVGFTLAEALAKARFIPSSLDSLVDRFRFGFFVDPFTDYNYSDLGNPEFYATIRDDQLGPKLTELNLEFKTEDKSTGLVTLPFNEFTIVSQNDATDGPVEGPVEVTVITQSTAVAFQSQRSRSNSDNGTVFEEFFYTMSTLAGPVEFYINSRDNNIALEVFQATTLGGEYTSTFTSAAAQAITNADITSKNLSVLNDGRRIEHPGSLIRKSYGPVGGFLEDQFKVLWNHNPNDGVYYKIRVYKGKNRGGQGRSGTYGFKLFYPTDVISRETRVVSNPANFGYTGVVHNVSPSEFTISLSTQFIGAGFFATVSPGEFISDAQKFSIAITGLKPNTYHKFMFDGSDQTAKCAQARTSTINTNGLLTDANGTLNFDFYFDAGINEATSDLEQQNRLAAAVAGIKVFSVESYDGNSRSTGSIGLKYYTNIPFGYADPVGLNTSQTATMASTSSGGSLRGGGFVDSTSLPGTSNIELAQSLNDAIDRSNVRYIDWRDISISNVQLQ
jgi:hypothetical protein